MRGVSNHDSHFYEIHKKLLTTALNMGIISFEKIQMYWLSNARNARKLAVLMKDYVPNPIEYKIDSHTILVYQAFTIKESLKERGYKWCESDLSWQRNISPPEIDSEKEYLFSLGVKEENILVNTKKGVTNRLKTIVELHGDTFYTKDLIRAFGYRWDTRKKIWYKQINDTDISEEEKKALSYDGKVKIVIKT